MDIKMFLEITGEFFDLMYTGGFYDYQEINENHEKKDIENASDNYEDFYHLNAHYIYKQLSLFMNPGIYDDNKIN